MFNKELEVFEVLLISLRLASLQDMRDEMKLYSGLLTYCGFSADVIESWSKPNYASADSLHDLLHTLKDYQTCIGAVPELFANGAMGEAFARIRIKAGDRHLTPRGMVFAANLNRSLQSRTAK